MDLPMKNHLIFCFILLVVCCQRSLSVNEKEFVNRSQSMQRNTAYKSEEVSVYDEGDKPKGENKAEKFSNSWPPEDNYNIYSKLHGTDNPLSIYDYVIRNRHKPIILQDKKRKTECEIKYFFNSQNGSFVCGKVKEDCHLEYNKFRSIVPDKNRCSLENNECILKKEVKSVTLPFKHIDCQKHRKKRSGLEAIENRNCKIYFIDDLATEELSCQMKNGQCYLGDNHRISIISDNKNCNLSQDRCIPLREFNTTLPFVDKICYEFDASMKIRKRGYSQTPFELVESGDLCELQMFRRKFYGTVNCRLIYGECFLESDNMVTILPDDENCFRFNNHCQVIPAFFYTNVPLVDKACDKFDEFILQILSYTGDYYRNSMDQNYNTNKYEELVGKSSVITGRLGYGGLDISGRIPEKNSRQEPDIWNDARYTGCVLVHRKKSDGWKERCYPSNQSNDDVLFENEKGCRLIDGKCFEVHTDSEFLKSFFDPAPNYLLPCIILEDICYLMDLEKNLLLRVTDDCSEVYCRRMNMDPYNPKNFCFTICPFRPPNPLLESDGSDLEEKYSEEGEPTKSDDVEPLEKIAEERMEVDETKDTIPVINDDVNSALLHGLKTIIPEHNIQGKPTGLFYSIAVLYNDSISSMLSMPNNTENLAVNTNRDINGTTNDKQTLVDIWEDPSYTECVTFKWMNVDKMQKRCFPGNDSTEEINPQFEDHCRLIDEKCYKVYKNENFVKSYFDKIQKKSLKCVKSDDGCFLINDDLLLHDKVCNELACRKLPKRPNISENCCRRNDKQYLADESSDTSKSPIPVQILNNESTSSLLQALKAIVPKKKFDENPSAIVYSIGMLFNSSEPTLSPPQSGSNETENESKEEFVADSSIYSNEIRSSSMENVSADSSSVENVIQESTYETPTKSTEYLVDNKDTSTERRRRKSEEKETVNSEFLFNPNSPFVFLGSYPGTTGSNDTLIINDKSYKNHDAKVPTMQRMRTKMYHLNEQLRSRLDEYTLVEVISGFEAQIVYWCYRSDHRPATIGADDLFNEARHSACCNILHTCSDVLQPYDFKYELSNESPYKRNHCDCDYHFFKCLKKSKNRVTNAVGVAYFNIISPKCFAFVERITCLSRNEWDKCDKYGYHPNSDFEYQWLETPTYLV